ncbi:hypothetical protein [Yinghuangia seranimata]|uniref:hypothetical protein n=1 Tax=Yinghuangia seranimata TaxID=408067 RepID=UPI00248CD3D8|nr:hypothetical protein [Yinghuangia seranimata]MDI2125999.1 hypothetical protein [Yinghuangia seranimata]
MRRHLQTAKAFARFVVFGGGVGLLSSAALVALSASMGVAAANAVVTVLGTLLVNELHSRFTFRRGAAGWRVHLESSGTVVVGYLLTTAAMLALAAAAPDAGMAATQAVYLGASALTGIGRFVALRLVVFANAPGRAALVAVA